MIPFVLNIENHTINPGYEKLASNMKIGRTGSLESTFNIHARERTNFAPLEAQGLAAVPRTFCPPS
jgi:hypothetical protein